MKMFFKRTWRGWFPEHIIHVSHGGEVKKIHAKELSKITPKRIKGVRKSGETFELVSIEPMEYYIVEYRDDLK